MTIIRTPCSEDWNAMTPAGGGRHCARCERVVHDLTVIAPSQAAAILREAGLGERVCVRARATHDGRIVLPGTRRRLLTNGIAAVLALSAAGCGHEPAASAVLDVPTAASSTRSTAQRSEPARDQDATWPAGLADLELDPDEPKEDDHSKCRSDHDLDDSIHTTITGDIGMPPPPGPELFLIPPAPRAPGPRTNG